MSTKPTQPGATTEDSVRRVSVYGLPQNIEAFFDTEEGTHALMPWEYHEEREAEIERLRAKRFHTGEQVMRHYGADKSLAEIERLRAELALKTADHETVFDEYKEQQAEIERLRKRIEELERKASVAGVLPMDTKGIYTTIDQIAKAWEMTEGGDYSPLDLMQVFVSGLDYCKGCEGSGRIDNWKGIKKHGKRKCPDCAKWGSHGFVIGGE